jgi:hypothetical protein
MAAAATINVNFVAATGRNATGGTSGQSVSTTNSGNGSSIPAFVPPSTATSNSRESSRRRGVALMMVGIGLVAIVV